MSDTILTKHFIFALRMTIIKIIALITFHRYCPDSHTRHGKNREPSGDFYSVLEAGILCNFYKTPDTFATRCSDSYEQGCLLMTMLLCRISLPRKFAVWSEPKIVLNHTFQLSIGGDSLYS